MSCIKNKFILSVLTFKSMHEKLKYNMNINYRLGHKRVSFIKDKFLIFSSIKISGYIRE